MSGVFALASWELEGLEIVVPEWLPPLKTHYTALSLYSHFEDKFSFPYRYLFSHKEELYKGMLTYWQVGRSIQAGKLTS